MQNIRIEKRIPFGFRGDWGKVYKQYNFEEEESNSAAIKWKDSTYAELGQDIQFKYTDQEIDKQTKPAEPIENRVSKGEYRIVETTDAYFDVYSNQYECVVSIGDIVNVFGCWWVVDNMDDKSIHTPNKQTFYLIALKRINEEIITL